jgi:hypothetical protein
MKNKKTTFYCKNTKKKCTHQCDECWDREEDRREIKTSVTKDW